MNVLEELLEIEDQSGRDHVERRLRDWEQRLDRLYRDVEAWLPEGWRAWRSGEVLMHEELMRRCGIDPLPLPVLRLEQDGILRGRIEPRALWIIGINGRVDLIVPNGHYLIIDQAEAFEAPDWEISDLRDLMKETPFTRESLIKSLT